MVLLLKTGRLKLPSRRKRQEREGLQLHSDAQHYSCRLTCTAGGERSAAIIMHPDKHLPELVAEKNSLDPSFVHAVRLLAEGKSNLTLELLWHHVSLQLKTPLQPLRK